MSKKAQPQHPVVVDNSKRNKILLISIVCFVTALVITASLIIALWDYTDGKGWSGGGGESLDRSSEPISNGNFEFLEELYTSFPKIAQDWTKYTYKKPVSSTSHGYNKVTAAHPTLMGVIDTATDEWDKVQTDLAAAGVTLTNPGNPNDPDKTDDSLVYMVHNFEVTTASIYSSSFSIPATTAVKITVDMKTIGMTENVGAFVMIKQQSSSALEKSSTDVQYWYAHKGVVDGDNGIDTNGNWETFEFFIFNRTSSSKTVYFNAGLGNVYTGAGETGTLFVDNVEIEDATSDDYRQVVQQSQNHPDPNDHTSYIIEAESNSNQISYVDFANFSLDAISSDNSVTEADYLADYDYMPAFEFITDEAFTSDYIHKISNNGTVNAPLTATSNSITIKSPATSSQYLISLWLRVKSENNTILPNANVYLVGPDGDLSSFTTVRTSDKLETDTNNGWVKCSFYIQPSDKSDISVSVMVAFGDKVGYSNDRLIPNGSVYFTDLIVEEITQSQFAKASTGTYAQKVSLNGTVSTTSVPNGSFSSYVTNSNSTDPLVFPKDWTPVFAGQNELRKDGQDNISVNTSHNAVESGILLGGNQGPVYDDEIGGILKIDNKQATSFGYLSGNFTLSAKTVYVISILVKADATAVPSVYLMEEDANGILKSYEGIPTITSAVDSEKWFNDPDPDVNALATADQGGWTKLFFVVATGDKSVTAKLALFNGTIDATDSSGTSVGTVYFDRITVETIGTFVRDNETNDLWQMDANEEEFLTDSEGNYILVTDDEILKAVTDTISSGYGKSGNTVYYEDFKTLFSGIANSDNVEIVDLRFESKYINDPTLEEEEEEETTPSEIDWALLVSIISSSVLIGALIVVVFVKFIFRRQRYVA